MEGAIIFILASGNHQNQINIPLDSKPAAGAGKYQCLPLPTNEQYGQFESAAADHSPLAASIRKDTVVKCR
jgi:hypothetical protein